MPPQEYHVPKADIRKFSDKLAIDKNGLPVGKAPSTKTSFLCKEKESDLYERIQKLAVQVHKRLQFKDFSMVDLRVDSEGMDKISNVLKSMISFLKSRIL